MYNTIQFLGQESPQPEVKVFERIIATNSNDSNIKLISFWW